MITQDSKYCISKKNIVVVMTLFLSFVIFIALSNFSNYLIKSKTSLSSRASFNPTAFPTYSKEEPTNAPIVINGITDNKECGDKGLQWYERCNKCAAIGTDVNTVCYEDQLTWIDPRYGKLTDKQSCNNNGGSWYYSYGYKNCKTCAKKGTYDLRACASYPDGSSPYTLRDSVECIGFDFQWYERCGKCDYKGKSLNDVCSDMRLTWIDPDYGQYTDIDTCKNKGGEWIYSYDTIFQNPNSMCGVCISKEKNISHIKACAPYPHGSTPDTLFNYEYCTAFDFQWYERCRLCAIKSNKSINEVCNTYSPVYIDPNYGQYSNEIDCRNSGGAWNTTCSSCAEKGVLDSLVCGNIEK